ncbi:SRPBCC family protein [Agromyces sp. MMS24-JH15]|uniref:SRPBCC family protein n=1 Tax=Agromyces sp. MMS24-JH15 TaxID=3243765 RepID=UPI00374A5C95
MSRSASPGRVASPRRPGASDYRFVTRWSVPAPAGRVWRELTDPVAVPTWWPGFERVDVVRPGDETGLGTVCDCRVRSTLPMTLRFRLEVVRADPAHRVLESVASGELEGRGRMTLTAAAGATDVEWLWEVHAAKRAIRLLSPVLKPVFERNHDRVMTWGRDALVARLAD